MPDMDGVEFVYALLQRRRHPEPPLLIATSAPRADLVEVMRTLVSTVTDPSICVELVCSKACWEALVGARRQARLRREYAPWYPLIGVTAWMPAQSAANAVRRQLVDGEPPWAPKWELGRRVLDDRHFLFRGGADRDATQRTRSGDTATTHGHPVQAVVPHPHPPHATPPNLAQPDVT